MQRHVKWLRTTAPCGGGIMGSYLGSKRLAVRAISLFLATVLLIAGMKLLFTR